MIGKAYRLKTNSNILNEKVNNNWYKIMYPLYHLFKSGIVVLSINDNGFITQIRDISTGNIITSDMFNSVKGVLHQNVINEFFIRLTQAEIDDITKKSTDDDSKITYRVEINTPDDIDDEIKKLLLLKLSLGER